MYRTSVFSYRLKVRQTMNQVDQIPQFLLRLAGLRNLPAVPIDILQIVESLPKLLVRLI